MFSMLRKIVVTAIDLTKVENMYKETFFIEFSDGTIEIMDVEDEESDILIKINDLVIEINYHEYGRFIYDYIREQYSYSDVHLIGKFKNKRLFVVQYFQFTE